MERGHRLKNHRCMSPLGQWHDHFTKIAKALFLKASALTGGEFISRLKYCASAWLPARDLVKEALLARGIGHPDKRVLMFERSVPWKVSMPLISFPPSLQRVLMKYIGTSF